MPASAAARAIPISPSGSTRRWYATGATRTGADDRRAQDLGRGRYLTDVDQHPRPQPPARPGGDVVGQRQLVAGATGEVPEHPVVELGGGDPLEVGDVDQLGLHARDPSRCQGSWRRLSASVCAVIARRRPTRRQIRRRRRTALGVFAVLLVGVAYLVLAATVFAPVDKHGASLTHIEVHSKAVGRDLGVNVIVPPNAGPKGKRSLLVFLHGRGGYEGTFNDAVFRGLPSLHGHRGTVVAFPAGGVHGYWHDRADGDWERWVMDEVIPLVEQRFGIDPHKLAIGGISMGGFGAYDIALKNPGVSAPSAATPPPSGSTAPKPHRALSTMPPTSTATTSSARSRQTPMPSATPRSGTTTAKPTTSAPMTKASCKRWKRATPTSPPTHGRAATKAATGTPTGPPTSASTSTPSTIAASAACSFVALWATQALSGRRSSVSGRASPRAAPRAVAPGPSSRGRRRWRSGSRDRPLPACPESRRRSP